MSDQYYTSNVGTASFLRYVLGDDAHLMTTKIAKDRITFAFHDEPKGRCKQLTDAYFSDESAAVGSARELLDCCRAVRATVSAADRSSNKSWDSKDGL